MKHIQAAPATSWALHYLPDVTRTTMSNRLALVYITVAALADRDLYSGDGYTSHHEGDLARLLLHMEKEEIRDALGELHGLGWLEVRTGLGASGDEYRIPQAAFDAANEG